MTGYIVAALVVIGLVAVYVLLIRVTSEGGASDRDASAIANQVLGEADAYRGSRSADDPPLDGQVRLAPPTQDGGFG